MELVTPASALCMSSAKGACLLSFEYQPTGNISLSGKKDFIVRLKLWSPLTMRSGLTIPTLGTSLLDSFLFCYPHFLESSCFLNNIPAINHLTQTPASRSSRKYDLRQMGYKQDDWFQIKIGKRFLAREHYLVLIFIILKILEEKEMLLFD